MRLKPDSFGTVWYVEEDGERVPVNPEVEFGEGWIGFRHENDEEVMR